MDYEETFAHVAKISIVCTLIVIFQWKIYKMDVKNVLGIYMTPPLGLSNKSSEVCKLQKALYGLKQAPYVWFQKFSAIIVSFGFFASHHDFAIFVRKTNVGRILISLYVDDMIITADDIYGIASLKIALSHCFTLKDLSVLHYFWGIEVVSSSKGYLLLTYLNMLDLLTTRLLILHLR